MSCTTRRERSLPERLLVGYANWNQSDESLVRAVRHGVNVLIWFSINLSLSSADEEQGEQGEPCVTSGPDMDRVALRIAELRSLGREDVLHLISIGGWNSPHPETTHSAERVFSAWDEWNTRVAARPTLGFEGFDGLDWDVEGNDDEHSPFNAFSVKTLDLMGRVSQLAKQSGYVVAMAPAESYLDFSRPQFDRSLTHEYSEWQGRIPRFAYHGLNAYAYLLARYAHTEAHGETFDFITVQLYEGYSHAQYQCVVQGRAPHDVLTQFVREMARGAEIDFSVDEELRFPHKVSLSVPPNKLVVGLANGWAGDGKFLLIYPEEVQKAYEELREEGLEPRGFAFWNILDEGLAAPPRPSQPLWLAMGLNRFLRTHQDCETTEPLQKETP